MAGSGAAGVQGDLRYRDKYFLRLINIGDREDEEGIKTRLSCAKEISRRSVFTISVRI